MSLEHDEKTLLAPLKASEIKEINAGVNDFSGIVIAPKLASSEDLTRLEVSLLQGEVSLQEIRNTSETGDGLRHANSDEMPQESSLAPEDRFIGCELKGRYRILEKLGSGGMGMVFKALDLVKVEAKSKNPYIAIKVLNPIWARNETLVIGLHRECEKAQELSHPNIITVYDSDRDGEFVFMSMEFLSGTPLNQLIKKGGITLQRAWPIIQKMGEALAYAHSKNIVHSDFKPGNVFITDSGEVKVLDFGIASRTRQASEVDATVFDPRGMGGLTVAYACLEMWHGEAPDTRDDIYAFGLVVYELLTGKHPYGGQPANEISKAQRNGMAPTLEPVKGLTKKQWRLLKSTLNISQTDRPKDLARWLKEFESGGHKNALLLPMTFGLVSLTTILLSVVFWSKHHQSIDIAPVESASHHEPPTNPGNFTLPIADPGPTRQALVGQKVQLNGQHSRTGDGAAIHYRWKLVNAPDASQVLLENADTVMPHFIPDKVGNYAIELTVMDEHNQSLPVMVLVQTESPATPVNYHEASSQTGSLTLKAGKPRYKIGQELLLTFKVSKRGYLRVIYLGGNGEINEIFPNPYQSNPLIAGKEYSIPPKNASFKMEVVGPVGIDRVIGVFSETPLTKVKNITDALGNVLPEILNQGVDVVTISYEVTK